MQSNQLFDTILESIYAETGRGNNALHPTSDDQRSLQQDDETTPMLFQNADVNEIADFGVDLT